MMPTTHTPPPTPPTPPWFALRFEIRGAARGGISLPWGTSIFEITMGMVLAALVPLPWSPICENLELFCVGVLESKRSGARATMHMDPPPRSIHVPRAWASSACLYHHYKSPRTTTTASHRTTTASHTRESPGWPQFV